MSMLKPARTRVCMVLAAALLLGGLSQAQAENAYERAQAQREARRNHEHATAETKAVQPAALYPDATRQAPEGKATAKLGPKLTQLVELYQADKSAEARTLADEIMATAGANPYEVSFAAQIAAQSAYTLDDNAAAMAYLKQAIDTGGLDNNGHYQSMYMLAQLQLQDEQYADSLATLDRFLAETKSRKPEYLALKGNALYRLERYPEAAAVLKEAVAASPESRSDWLQLLMGAYFEMKQPAEAAKIAEELQAKNPNDAQLQMNLASIYMQSGQDDKAAALLEKLRAGGQLKDEKDYRALYALYLNADGREKDAVAVINEGLQKGLLKPDYQTNLALAQAYYFSGQTGPAIEAYQKAAPLAPDGETYLNLAKALSNEGRTAEARQAAQKALDKGVANPADARKLLGQKGK